MVALYGQVQCEVERLQMGIGTRRKNVSVHSFPRKEMPLPVPSAKMISSWSPPAGGVWMKAMPLKLAVDPADTERAQPVLGRMAMVAAM